MIDTVVCSHLVLGRGQLLRVGEVVHGDGEEDVEEGVVPEEGEHDEVERVDHAVADAALRHDAVVHHLKTTSIAYCTLHI